MQKSTSASNLQNIGSKESLTDDDQLPKYKLRLNAKCCSFDDQNWIKTPVLSPDVNVDLSPEQCEETFKFFLLSGDRLTQMTRTYHDIDAVLHLLEEKERDLELAARIGQTLLYRNKEVAEQNNLLEEKLAIAVEEASQLRHEVSNKEKLLHLYAEAEISSEVSSEEIDSLQIRIRGLNNKIEQLEKDKSELIRERSVVESFSEETLAKEHKLVTSTVEKLCILQSDLQSANTQILAVTDELTKRNSEASKQQDDISILLNQIDELQSKHKHLMNEHNELQHQLTVANHSQHELSVEVQNLESKYHDVVSMLGETQEEMRLFRDLPFISDTESSDTSINPWHIPYESSLAAEIKSCGSDFTFDHTGELNLFGNNTHRKQSYPNTTFPCTSKINHDILKTVRYANKSSSGLSEKLSLNRSLPANWQKPPFLQKPKWLVGSPSPLLQSPDLGQPGVPGTTDLQRAIEKLTRVGKESLNFVQQTRFQLLQTGKSPQAEQMKKYASTPKLRIVKPLEGSLTLHQWKSLADKTSVFSSALKNPVTSSGIIMRGSISQQSADSLNMAKTQNSIELFSYSKSVVAPPTEVGASGVMLSMPSNDITGAMSPQTGLSKNRSPKFKSKIASTSTVLRTVQSTPHLPSLAAALMPSKTLKSIVHGASSLPVASESSSLDMAQLHGCEHHDLSDVDT